MSVPYAAAVRPRGARAARRGHAARAGRRRSGMFAAYALALAALERAEAAPVAALRETSVVMATRRRHRAGARAAPPRAPWRAPVAVVAGVAAIALG